MSKLTDEDVLAAVQSMDEGESRDTLVVPPHAWAEIRPLRLMFWLAKTALSGFKKIL